MTIVLDFPHDTRTHETLQLDRRDIWRLAEDARAQLGTSRTPQLQFADLVARTRNLRVNGVELLTAWNFEPKVLDERNRSMLGSIEYDPAVPRTAFLSLSSSELAERDDLVRSTAAHELAHAIFDAPGWVIRSERRGEGAGPRTNGFRTVVRRYRSSSVHSTMEWRANEFMGAFLAPPGWVRPHMLKVLARLGLPRRLDDCGSPVLDTRKIGVDQIQAVADELAEQFGVSIAFMEYRLHRYQLAPKVDP